MINFWARLKQFFKNLFVRTEWTFTSVLYVIGWIILGILLLPFIIVAAIFGLIIWLLMYPSILRTRKQLEAQMKQMDPNFDPKQYKKDLKNQRKRQKEKPQEANIVEEEVNELDKETPQLD